MASARGRKGVDRVSTTATGNAAENAARRFLEARGVRLIERNFRCRSGEIDLVMQEGTTVLVVEVRYRRDATLVHPALTVTARKRRRLLHATALLLRARPELRDRPLRFDVLALCGDLRAPRCDWLRGAFDAGDVW